MKEVKHPFIERKEGILSREPIIRGTRTPVRAIVELTQLGQSPKRIMEGLPHLNLDSIYAALSYYNSNREEIDWHIERNAIPDHLVHPSVRDL